MTKTNLLKLLLIIAAAFAQNVAAQQFTSQNDGFTAWLSGKPTPQIQTINSDVGKITLKLYLVGSPNGAHGVSVNQYPIATEDPAVIETRIDSGVESLLKGRKASKISEKAVFLGPHKGREVYFSYSDGVGRVKVFLVKYNLYQIISIGRSSYVNSATMTKFFNSFKLTEGNTGEKWAAFSSNTSGFSVLFPTKPQISTKQIGTDGTKKMIQNTFSASSESEEYGVVVTDIRKEFMLMSKPQMLDYLRNAVDPAGTEDKKEIVINGEQGIEFFMDISGKRTKIWSTIKNGRSYQIFFRGSNEKLSSQEVQSFFESFKFVNSPAKTKGK